MRRSARYRRNAIDRQQSRNALRSTLASLQIRVRLIRRQSRGRSKTALSSRRRTIRRRILVSRRNRARNTLHANRRMTRRGNLRNCGPSRHHENHRLLRGRNHHRHGIRPRLRESRLHHRRARRVAPTLPARKRARCLPQVRAKFSRRSRLSLACSLHSSAAGSSWDRRRWIVAGVLAHSCFCPLIRWQEECQLCSRTNSCKQLRISELEQGSVAARGQVPAARGAFRARVVDFNQRSQCSPASSLPSRSGRRRRSRDLRERRRRRFSPRSR